MSPCECGIEPPGSISHRVSLLVSYIYIPKKRRDLRIKGNNKHTEACLICFENHRIFFQSEEDNCMWNFYMIFLRIYNMEKKWYNDTSN